MATLEEKIAELEKKIEDALNALEGTEGKPWYQSKTVWVNAIAAVAFVIQAFAGFPVSPAVEGLVLGVVNIALRAITKKPLQ